MPGASRPARPARWLAMSSEMRVVWRWLSPVWGLKMGCRHSPESITVCMPSMVSDVSAMGVASTILRWPGRLGAMARCCSVCGRRL